MENEGEKSTQETNQDVISNHNTEFTKCAEMYNGHEIHNWRKKNK